MICPGCRTENVAGKMLCYKCGANLFQASEEAPQERKKKGGCVKGCLTGCLVVVLLGMAVSLSLWINRERVAEFFLERMERAVFSVVSEEVDKEEVRGVIAEVKEASERGELDPVQLEKAVRELSRYIADGKLDKEETGKLMESFREAIRVEEERVPAP